MNKYSVLAAAIVFSLSGCGGKDAADHYADAKQYLAQNNLSAATIELKSAVQQAPENSEYRIALAQAHSTVGDVASAAKEYERAISLGADKNTYLVPLFKSWHLARDSKPILSKFIDDSTVDSVTNNYLNLYRAMTELETGNNDKAIALFTQLSQLQDNSDVAMIAAAYLDVIGEKFDVALEKANNIQTTAKLYDESLLLRARLYQLLNKPELGNQAFKQYLEKAPTDFTSRLMYVQGLLQVSDLEQADKELEPVLKLFPKQPLANSLKAHILFDRKDYTGAKESAETAIYGGLADVRTRILAAVSAVQLDLRSQALAHLDAVKDSLGQNNQVNTMYNMLLLDAGRVNEVNESLKNQDPTKLDYKIVASTVHRLMKSGDVANARQLIDRFEAAASDDPEAKTTLATLKMDMKGMKDQGLAELESALAADPTQDKARVVLVQNYIRNQQFDKALELIDRWINEEKTAAIGYNMKAYVLFLQGHEQQANEWINKALSLEPTNPFSLLLKSASVVKAGDKNAAETLLTDLVTQHPTYIPGLVQYYTIMNEQKKSAKALETLRKIQQAHQQNPAVRLTLASIESAANNPDAVIKLLTDNKVADDAKTAEYWGFLIQAYLKKQNVTQALLTAKQWLAVVPDDINAILTNTQLVARHGERKEAFGFLDNALAKRPDNQLLLRAKAILLAEDAQYKAALATLDKLGKDMNESAELLFIRARMHFADGDISAAQKDASASYDKNKTPVALTMLAELTAKTAGQEAAVSVIRKHLQTQGETPEVKVLLANYLLATAPDEALKIYKTLSGQFTDVLVQNNYAWLLAEKGELTEAEQAARKALEMAPGNPDVLDTLGTVLLKQKKYTEAQQQFAESLKLRPRHPEVTMNYAEALAAGGNKQEALKQLNNVNTQDPVMQKRLEQIKQRLQ